MGMTDEQTVCDACGRTELRGTVLLADADGTIAYRLGTSCASRVLGRRVTRDDGRRLESARRHRVGALLALARADADAGRLASAAERAHDARAAGLHLPAEIAAVAAVLEQVASARAAKSERWGFSRDGGPVVELDSLADVQAVIDRARTAPYRSMVTAHLHGAAGWAPSATAAPLSAHS